MKERKGKIEEGRIALYFRVSERENEEERKGRERERERERGGGGGGGLTDLNAIARYCNDFEPSVLVFTSALAFTVTFFDVLGTMKGLHSGTVLARLTKQLRLLTNDGSKH